MASNVEQFRTWDNAKALAGKLNFDEALKLYRSVETDFSNLPQWRTDKSDSDNMFYQAMFYGDYCGALCNAGDYTEAKKKGDIALKHMKTGKFTSLKYIYYNIGNIYLFQKEYTQACKWYELALEGATYFYTSVNNYLVNYGIAQYFLGITDKAKDIFQLAIKESQGTKYNTGFEPFYFLMKISNLQGDEKACTKYKKMYLTRLKKYSLIELQFAIQTMENKEEVANDYVNVLHN